jgi:hypothetical protein
MQQKISFQFLQIFYSYFASVFCILTFNHSMERQGRLISDFEQENLGSTRAFYEGTPTLKLLRAA